MAKFHTLSVKDIKQETSDTVSVSFDVPEALANEFVFKQGQYLTLRTTINGEDVRRSYSICTAPSDNDLRVAIKQVENGRFSTFANNTLSVGDALEVMPPMGNFYTELDANQRKNYVLFAAGSGITPVISIIKTTLATEPNSQVTLFYGNKGFDSIIFREELEGLKNVYVDRFSLYHILSRESLGVPLYKGRIDAEKCNNLCTQLVDVSTVDEFFICGPESMIHGVSDALQAMGVDKKQVHFELFTSPLGSLAGADKTVAETTDDGTDSHVTIILDGDEHEFKLGAHGDSILDAAMQQGADVPFACKGGVCCTCRAKVLEGEVTMDVNYALEEEEVEAGFILTCQSHPKTDKVVIDFDAM